MDDDRDEDLFALFVSHNEFLVIRLQHPVSICRHIYYFTSLLKTRYGRLNVPCFPQK